MSTFEVLSITHPVFRVTEWPVASSSYFSPLIPAAIKRLHSATAKMPPGFSKPLFTASARKSYYT